MPQKRKFSGGFAGMHYHATRPVKGEQKSVRDIIAHVAMKVRDHCDPLRAMQDVAWATLDMQEIAPPRRHGEHIDALVDVVDDALQSCRRKHTRLAR